MSDITIGSLPLQTPGTELDTDMFPLQTAAGVTKRVPRSAISTSDVVFNVITYGAKGDGLTNDAIAIQSAITAANSAGGGIVFFPGGTYILGTGLILEDNVALEGTGFGSILKASGGGGLIYSFSGKVSNVAIRNLKFDADNISTVSCIQVEQFDNLILENLYCYNVNHVWSVRLGAWDTSEAASKSTNLTVRNVVVDTVTNTTLEPMIVVNTDYFNLDGLRFINCNVSSTASLSLYVNCRHGEVVGCQFIDSDDQAFQLNLTGCDNVSVKGNTFRWLGTAGGAGLALYNNSAIIVDDNLFDNKPSAVTTVGTSIIVRDWNSTLDGHPNPYPNSSNLTISNNSIHGGYNGISFTSDSISTKNLAQTHVIITNNSFAEFTFAAINVGVATRMTGTISDFTITNNNIVLTGSGDHVLCNLIGNSSYGLTRFVIANNEFYVAGANNKTSIQADYFTYSNIVNNRLYHVGSGTSLNITNDDYLIISDNYTSGAVSTAGTHNSFITPVIQSVLATGVGHTPDDIIAILQSLGIVRQS